jgi:hypothetical protein
MQLIVNKDQARWCPWFCLAFERGFIKPRRRPARGYCAWYRIFENKQRCCGVDDMRSSDHMALMKGDENSAKDHTKASQIAVTSWLSSMPIVDTSSQE